MILLDVQISFQFHFVRHRENITTNIKAFSLAKTRTSQRRVTINFYRKNGNIGLTSAVKITVIYVPSN
jgi:hypothetical protein